MKKEFIIEAKRMQELAGIVNEDLKSDISEFIIFLKEKAIIEDDFGIGGRVGRLDSSGKYKLSVIVPEDYKKFKEDIDNSTEASKVGKTNIGIDIYKFKNKFYFWFWVSRDPKIIDIQIRKAKLPTSLLNK